MLVGDASKRTRTGRNDPLVEAHPAQGVDAGRHHPLAAGLVTREAGTVNEDHVVSEPGEEQRGRRPTRTRTNHDGVGLHQRPLSQNGVAAGRSRCGHHADPGWMIGR